MRAHLPYPHTLPHLGKGADLKSSFVHRGFAAVRDPRRIPDFGVFRPLTRDRASRGLAAALALVAHATNGFTDGRVKNVWK